MTCSRTGNLDAVNLLLARHANVNAMETRHGQTALMWAVAEKHSEIVRALIEHRGRRQSPFKRWFHTAAVCRAAGRSGCRPHAARGRSECE